MLAVKGRVVTPERVETGAVTISGERIASVGEPADQGVTHDYGDALILPGFLDIHMHGLGPYGVTETDDILGVARLQPTYGTTGFLPGVASLSVEGYLEFVRNLRRAQGAAPAGSARILGAHFEGPFINPDRKGGMRAEQLRPVSLDECRLYLDEAGGALRMMTLSPELEGAEAVTRLLRERDVVVALGHSKASTEQIERAVAAGARHVCHLFNAFLRPREIEAGLWDVDRVFAIFREGGVNCELISDLHHVKPEPMRLAFQALGPDRIVAATDAMAGAGAGPGVHTMMDGRSYATHDGAARLVTTGALVGSVLTMNRAFVNLVERVGLDEVAAAKATATNAARALGLGDETGALEFGKRADIAVLRPDGEALATYLAGERVYVRD